ncbi:hypothetical protein [Nocardia aurea]|uniref:Uncharacterized protein n=1 Tax=Nocardia aurea TaxID=2144174 RepID=A0ABV3G4V5_9NOCA
MVEVLAEAHRYRTTCLLDCTVVDETLDIVVRDWSSLGAVFMPAVVGAKVHDRLTEPGPVIVVDDIGWIMFTTPITAGARQRWQPELAASKTLIIDPEAVVALPGPCRTDRRWLIPPMTGFRPLPEQVFTEIRRLAALDGVVVASTRKPA